MRAAKLRDFKWVSSQLSPCTFTCGDCGAKVVSERGMLLSLDSMRYDEDLDGIYGGVYICTGCNYPTLLLFKLDDREIVVQRPGVCDIPNIPAGPGSDEVISVYDEARGCMRAGCYTAVLVLCRKIIVNTAVAQGAPAEKANERIKFADYANFLKDNNHVHERSFPLLEHIIEQGGHAAHKIEVVTKKDAELTLQFTHYLLTCIYGLPELDTDVSTEG